jgi:hypothetical protein
MTSKDDFIQLASDKRGGSVDWCRVAHTAVSPLNTLTSPLTRNKYTRCGSFFVQWRLIHQMQRLRRTQFEHVFKWQNAQRKLNRIRWRLHGDFQRSRLRRHGLIALEQDGRRKGLCGG